jgi:hypothetical protein
MYRKSTAQYMERARKKAHVTFWYDNVATLIDMICNPLNSFLFEISIFWKKLNTEVPESWT